MSSNGVPSSPSEPTATTTAPEPPPSPPRAPEPPATPVTGAATRPAGPAAPGRQERARKRSRVTTDWRLTVEDRLRVLSAEHMRQGGTDLAVSGALEVVRRTLEQAAATRGRRRLGAWWSGWHIERCWRALHDAEARLLAASPDLAGRLVDLRQRVAKHLPPNDMRRRALEELNLDEQPVVSVRAVVEAALRASFDAADDAHNAVRALRNKLVLASFALVLLNVLVGVLSMLRPGLLPLCVGPDHTICPSGPGGPSRHDVWLVQLLGILGSVVGVVVMLARQRPSLTSYRLGGYQGVIKVLLGSTLAVVGLLALGADIVGTAISPQTRPALLLWAVVLGYSQQAGTRMLDMHAQRVMDNAKPLPPQRKT
ncbi:hypothetical protein GCM10012275_11980 [Longimycelium tulufanense]|uniref:Uncharacterized protein n=1 Tax=Longimycelium tulufanense TaxID=907463 RepID=A0A8J3FVA5_9PSEU|nr:hypothetical protein [Longimycelium tulufanense]GGM42629.1 hypothetical protein GCM10012275_11980 [Longimycelium tulufanense]